MNKTALERAVEAVPGKTKQALADSCGVTAQAVSQWFARGFPPASRCLHIEQATNGQVSRYELRPDIYGEEPEAA